MNSITVNGKEFKLSESFNSVAIQIQLIELGVSKTVKTLGLYADALAEDLSKEFEKQGIPKVALPKMVSKAISVNPKFIELNEELYLKLFDQETKPLNKLFSMAFENCENVDFYDYKEFHIKDLEMLSTFFLNCLATPYKELSNDSEAKAKVRKATPKAQKAK